MANVPDLIVTVKNSDIRGTVISSPVVTSLTKTTLVKKAKKVVRVLP